MYDVIIVGGGPGGISSLIWCHRLGLKTLLLERREELGGSLLSVNNPIIDYPGLPVVNGQELQKLMVAHVKELGCLYRSGAEVREFDLQEKRLLTDEGEFRARSLILSLGATDRRLAVPGEAEMIDRKEVYSASRDKDQFAGKKVAVVGGGDRAVEGALLLAEHGARVTLIHRRDQFRARKQYVDPVLHHPQIEILTDSVVTEIAGKHHVEGVWVAGRQDDGKLCAPRLVPADAVFVRIGVEPNSHLLKGQLDLDGDGYVRVDEAGETSVRNVFAVGDLRTRPIFSSVAGSVSQGMAAAKTISLRFETDKEL